MKWNLEAHCCGFGRNSDSRSWVLARRKLGIIISGSQSARYQNATGSLFPLQCWSMGAYRSISFPTRFVFSCPVQIGTVKRDIGVGGLLFYNQEIASRFCSYYQRRL